MNSTADVEKNWFSSIRAAPCAEGVDGLKTDNADQKAGVDIVRRAIQVPARQIVQNAGEDGSLVVGKLLDPQASRRVISSPPLGKTRDQPINASALYCAALPAAT